MPDAGTTQEARCDCGVGVPLRECIECGAKVCEKCAALTWIGNFCDRCLSESPVFFDRHSRSHGDTTTIARE